MQLQRHQLNLPRGRARGGSSQHALAAAASSRPLVATPGARGVSRALGWGSKGSEGSGARRNACQPPLPRVTTRMVPAARAAAPGAAEPATPGDGGSDALQEFFATCPPGLEECLAAELRDPTVGATSVSPGRAGVSFRGDMRTGYRANLWLRCAMRVLLLEHDGDVDRWRAGGDALYDVVRGAADWARLLPRGGSFTVDAHVWGNTDITSGQLVQTRTKDAICDAVMDATGDRPRPPEAGSPLGCAEMPLFVTVRRDKIRIFRDMSGVSLHRRGYRAAMHRASLNESVAAGVLRLGGWGDAVDASLAAGTDGEGLVLSDPMCGSGTLLIEGALLATNHAPGLFRTRWPFQTWPDYEREDWEACKGEAAAAGRPWRGRFLGNDIHPGAISLAEGDAEAAGVGDLVWLSNLACDEWKPSAVPSHVATNPPWGGRLDRDEADSLDATWRDLGDFLRGRCPGATAAVLSGNSRVTGSLRLRADRKHPVSYGGVDARVLQYKVREAPPGGGGGAGGEGGAARVCFNCGEAGHVSRDCHEPKAAPGKKFRPCYTCGEVGHLARDCPSAAAAAGAGAAGAAGGGLRARE